MKIANLTLEQLVARLESVFATKQELDQLRKELKNEMISHFDEVMVELKAIREEQTVGAYHRSELCEKLEKQDKRIKKIEKTVFPV